MKRKEEPDLNVREQVIAAQIGEINAERVASLTVSLGIQDKAFKDALDEINATRDFISRPQNILGSDLTKHGEVAEHLEVQWRRAWEFLHHEVPTATFEGVHRTAPEDYKIDGIDVQSKFLNGSKNTLDAVIEHYEKYSFWKEDGRFYHVPKDQYQQMLEVQSGNTPSGLSDRTAEQIREKIRRLEELCGGRKFEDIVQPARNDYRDVQLGRANKTLNADQSELSHENGRLKDDIRADHAPSLAEGLESAAYGAAFAAGIPLAYGVYGKIKDGKTLYSFTIEDWKELGLNSGSAGAGGAVAGASIYMLTNVAGCSAPFAAAFVGTVRGTVTQVELFNAGKISQGELIDNSIAISSEAGICGACAVMGQAIIPVPIVGAIVGGISGKFLAGIYKKTLAENSKELIARLDRQFEEAVSKLDKRYRALLLEIMADLEQMNDLIEFAFSPENNHRLMELSIVLAERTGVPSDQIITNHEQLNEALGYARP